MKYTNNRAGTHPTNDISIDLGDVTVILTHLPLDKMATILADNIFKYIFVNENFCILIDISLKFVPKGQVSSIPPLVQIMTWSRKGDKPLSEPMLTQFTDAYMQH